MLIKIILTVCFILLIGVEAILGYCVCGDKHINKYLALDYLFKTFVFIIVIVYFAQNYIL